MIHNSKLIQNLQGKLYAAKSLAEFIRYFRNWQDIWFAYRLSQQLPVFSLRSTDKSLLINHDVGDNPIFLFREIFIENCYTPSWFYQPSVNDTVIDLGANIGMFMLYLVWRTPGIKVYCFEPSNRTYRILETQVKANNLQDTVTVYPYAVFDKTGVISLKTSSDSGHQSLFKSEFVETKEELIEMLSLADAFEKCGVQNVDLLKIDVEGSEIEIVEAAPEAIWKLIDRVVVEYHDLFRSGCKERVCKCLSTHGFHNIQVQSLSPIDGLGIIYAQR